MLDARIGRLRAAPWVAVWLVAGSVSCGSEPGNERESGCTPGETENCTCPDGTVSVRSCATDRVFGECQCEGATPGTGGALTGGAGGLTGGSPGAGGTGTGGIPLGSGGDLGSGGLLGSGGDPGSGGFIGSGGELASGGTGVGGELGSGGWGWPGFGGDPGDGGTPGVGGDPGDGGTPGVGGNAGDGGEPGVGGVVGSGGSTGTGGADCSNGPLETSIPNCVLEPLPSTGDFHQDCVDNINQFRWVCQCLPPLERWVEGEDCANQMAEYDWNTGVPHDGFMSDICEPSGNGQCECPGWDSIESITQGSQWYDSCLQMMWSEVDEPSGEQGHYEAMSSTSYTRVACGIYEGSDGEVYSVQNYSR